VAEIICQAPIFLLKTEWGDFRKLLEGDSMKLMGVVLSFGFLLSGCVVTHNLTTEPQNSALTQANDRFRDERIAITTKRNQVYYGLFQGINSDSLRFINDLNLIESVPTSQIYRIKSSAGASGPIWMSLGGLFLGMLIGGTIGASDFEPDRNGGFEQVIVAPMEAYATTANGMLVGALIGLPLGFGIGSYMTAGHEMILNQP
jgi:hypothetical protein